MVEYRAFSHKIEYAAIFFEILNLEGHTNRITGSKVTAILLKGWILPIGGASVVEGATAQKFISSQGRYCPKSSFLNI